MLSSRDNNNHQLDLPCVTGAVAATAGGSGAGRQHQSSGNWLMNGHRKGATSIADRPREYSGRSGGGQPPEAALASVV